jgi:hypothetical protein
MGTRMVSIVTPVAMGGALMLDREKWGRSVVRLTIALAPLAAFVALVVWYRSHIYRTGDLTGIVNTMAARTDELRHAWRLLPSHIGQTTGLYLGVLGVGMLPLSIAALRIANLRRTLVVFAALALVLAVGAAFGVGYPLPLTTGQTWALNEIGGSYSLVSEYRVPPLPLTYGWVAFGVGVASIAVLIAAAQPISWHVGELFLVLAITGHGLAIALLWLIHDHYVLVVMPYAIALVLCARPSFDAPRATVALGIVACVAGTMIRDELSFNRTIWQAVDSARRAGAADSQINGGYVVNGWLQYAHPEHAQRDEAGRIRVAWINAAEDPPFKISHSDLAGWKRLETFTYRRWPRSTAEIYLIKAEP